MSAALPAEALPDRPLAVAGLTSAQVDERVSRGLVNRATTLPTRSVGEILRANIFTRFNLLLGVMVVLILVLVRDPRDALFGIVVVVNAAIGIYQELRAKRTLDRLTLLARPRVKVIRDGTEKEIAVDEVVQDDLVLLGPGDQVPVDGAVMEARKLEIDESLLTGESDPVTKAPGDGVRSGSFVVAGNGSIVAEAVGDAAFATRLLAEAKQFAPTRSELRRGIDWLIAAVSWLVIPIILMLAWNANRAGEPVREAVRSAVAGAVAIVPQGLVLLSSIAFFVGVARLGRRRVLVQELQAVEGLARVDTVCFDKTGTLTEGRLRLDRVEPLDGRDAEAALRALGAADPSPNATMQAIVEGLPGGSDWEPVDEVPFSSERKWSAVSFGGHGTWLLGAPDILLGGEPAARAEAIAGGGSRVLALAVSEDGLDGDALPASRAPAAIVVLEDVIRPDAAGTVEYFLDQGVRPVVISGDDPATVGSVAGRVGVPGADEPVDARDLGEDAPAIADAVASKTVFGRVTPQQKRMMVEALKEQGRVVAMTGDGVNDTLALKTADMGIAMGSGSAAARSVSQVVLLDGRFSEVPDVVGEGRRVIANVERVANLFVTKTAYAVLLAIVVVVFTRPFPFLPRHLTLVGSLTIGIPGFLLALAPNAPRARPGFLGRVLRFSIPVGAAAAAATLFGYELAIRDPASLEVARSVATIVLTGIGLIALGLVARPLVPWKQGLITLMASAFALILAVPAFREFWALPLPDLTLFLASFGVVAIVGAGMLGVLQLLGWSNEVRILFFEPPKEGKGLRARLRRLARRSGFEETV